MCFVGHGCRYVTPLRLVAAMRTLLTLSAVTVVHEARLARNWDIELVMRKLSQLQCYPPVTRQGVV